VGWASSVYSDTSTSRGGGTTSTAGRECLCVLLRVYVCEGGLGQ
jgi:hypothetical protein